MRRAPSFADLLCGAVMLAAFAGLAVVLFMIGEDSPDLRRAVADRLDETGLANPVNAVLIDFRAFDTLMEKGVLIIALLGLWGLTPDRAWGGAPANFRTGHEVEPPLAILLKVLVPLVAISAVYLLFVGADDPGGAFQAGTVFAAIAILLVLARAVPFPTQASRPLRWAIIAGFLLFVATGLALMAFGRGFLDYPDGWHKPFILGIEIGLTVSVAATLLMLASGLPDAGESEADGSRAPGKASGDGGRA